jgi:hypothetical protein
MVWGVSEDGASGEIVFHKATFDTLIRLKERVKDGGFLDNITNVNKFQDQNSDAANTMLSLKTTGPLRQNLDLPNARATLVHIEAHRLLQEPIRDPSFGSPLKVHRAVWTGQHLITFQREIAKQTLKSMVASSPRIQSSRT